MIFLPSNILDIFTHNFSKLWKCFNSGVRSSSAYITEAEVPLVTQPLYSSCITDRYLAEHLASWCDMVSCSKSQRVLCVLPVIYSPTDLQYWSFLHCHHLERGSAIFLCGVIFHSFFPKWITRCDFDISVAQITWSNLCNVTADKLVLINEPVQLLFTNWAPSLQV